MFLFWCQCFFISIIFVAKHCMIFWFLFFLILFIHMAYAVTNMKWHSTIIFFILLMNFWFWFFNIQSFVFCIDSYIVFFIQNSFNSMSYFNISLNMYIQIFLFLWFKKSIFRHMIFLIDFISFFIFFKRQNWMKIHEILKYHINLILIILLKKHFIFTNTITTKNSLIKISTINELIYTTKFFIDVIMFFYFDMKTTYF